MGKVNVSEQWSKKTTKPYNQKTHSIITKSIRKKKTFLWILRIHRKTIFKPNHTIRNIQGNPGEKVQLEYQGVYSTSCAANKTYIGNPNKRVSEKCEEYILSIRNKYGSAFFYYEHEKKSQISFETCQHLTITKTNTLASQNTSHQKIGELGEVIETRKGSLDKRGWCHELTYLWKMGQ